VTWNNKPGSGALAVIEAFLSKKEKSKNGFVSTGDTYVVHRMALAKHVVVPVNEAVAHKLLTGSELMQLAFRLPDDRNYVFAYHLNLFDGMWAMRQNDGITTLNNKRVELRTWYTLEELEAMPDYVAPLKRRDRVRFVNLTPSLFA
jgi:hypothetical protein